MMGARDIWTTVREAMAGGRQGLLCGSGLRGEAWRSLRLALGPGRRVVVVAEGPAVGPDVMAPAVLATLSPTVPVDAVLVEDWDELAPTPVGVRLQLTLAKLRALNPALKTWGLAAACGSGEELARALLAPGVEPLVITATETARVRLATLAPDQLSEALDSRQRSLVVTAGEESAERWQQKLPDAAVVAVTEAPALLPEAGRVFLVGSPRLLAPLLPRLDARVTVTCVPTHGLELLEIAAARRLLAKGAFGGVVPATGTAEELTEHFRAVARGGAFTAAELLAQARATAAYESFDANALSLCLREALAPRRSVHVVTSDAAPLPSPLDDELRRLVGELARGLPATEPETVEATALIDEQARLSHVPRAGELLLETWETPAGSALFVHPFAGRDVHEGLAVDLAVRLSRTVGAAFQVTVTDHGFSLRTDERVAFRELVSLPTLAGRTWVWHALRRPSPLAAPLLPPMAPSPDRPKRPALRPLFSVPPAPAP